ncbi:MAG: sulfotransferase [Nitrospirota bacterium]|jgi:hypothetical protein
MSDTSATDVELPVARWVDRVGGFIARHRGLWVRLGNLETRALADKIQTIAILQPIYVTGLARAGSTLLLEVLARHPETATHQYQDYPPVYTPYWWNWFLGFMPEGDVEPVERAHKDRIRITPKSPEAMEEVLWMTFFPDIHDPGASNLLDGRTRDEAFESFYRDHIRKLLLVRGGSRYLAKANYNLTRLEYLLKLFPDARFVVPIRDPVHHVASLQKQHGLFCRGETRNPRALEHMRRVGHFEFGLDRRPINVGDTEQAAAIARLWEEGDEVRGLARQWHAIYGHLADRLEANAALREAVLVIPYEELCRRPREWLTAMLAHARLDDGGPLVDEHAPRISAPNYYRPAFTDDELIAIRQETAATAARFGYDASSPPPEPDIATDHSSAASS